MVSLPDTRPLHEQELADTPTNGSLSKRSSGLSTLGGSASPKPTGVSLAAADHPGYHHQMLTPIIFLALGTTGSRIVARTLNLVKREVGRIPKSIVGLLLDGAQAKASMRGCHHIDMGLNGCGSDPNQGRWAFWQKYETILHAVEQAALRLDHLDPLLPAKKPMRQATTFYVIGGNGGSSGGMQEPAISLCHHVGRRINIHNMRVNMVNLGAEMATQDVNRTVSLQQKRTVPQTAADNLARCLADHHSSERVLVHPPGDFAFSLRRCDLIWRLFLLDQGNGHHQFATTEEFIEMAALYFRGSLLTSFSESIEDRFVDHDKLHGNLRGEGTRQPH